MHRLESCNRPAASVHWGTPSAEQTRLAKLGVRLAEASLSTVRPRPSQDKDEPFGIRNDMVIGIRCRRLSDIGKYTVGELYPFVYGFARLRSLFVPSTAG